MGLLSTWGFVKSPFFGNVDTCGISNLHGMPGIFGGIVSALVPFFYHGTGIVAQNQAIGLAATLVVAGVTGCITGALLKAMNPPKLAFCDSVFWDCADDISK